jgi:hypothetical protein
MVGPFLQLGQRRKSIEIRNIEPGEALPLEADSLAGIGDPIADLPGRAGLPPKLNLGTGAPVIGDMRVVGRVGREEEIGNLDDAAKIPLLVRLFGLRPVPVGFRVFLRGQRGGEIVPILVTIPLCRGDGGEQNQHHKRQRGRAFHGKGCPQRMEWVAAACYLETGVGVCKGSGRGNGEIGND